MSNNQNDIKKELKHLAPHLSKLEKAMADEIPDGYFDHLPNRLLDRLKEQDNEPSLGMSNIRYMFRRYAMPLAAVFILLLTSVFIFRNQLQTDSTLINEDEWISYYIENIDEVDDDVLLSLIEEETLNAFELEIDNETIDYFLNENIDDFDDELLEDLF